MTKKADNIPVYDIKPEHCNNVKTKRVHRNIVMPCNLLLANKYKKKNKNKKSKSFSDKVDRSQSVEGSDSDSEILIAYSKVLYPKEVQHSEKSDFHHLNTEGQGIDSRNNLLEPLSTTDQTESENDSHHEFIPRRSSRVKPK